MSYTLLFVCTANQCRSPMAQFLAQQRLSSHPSTQDWAVRSAGVHVADPMPIHPLAGAELTRRGLSPAGFASTLLTRELVSSSDLILTAETEHRSAVARLVPAAARKVFTILQFAALCRSLGPSSVDTSHAPGVALHEAALSKRGLRSRSESDDIPDPINRRRRAFRQCASTIESALSEILDPLVRNQN